MKTDPVLQKAAQLTKKHNYAGALSLLKADEERFYDSFKYYYLYGVISLYAGNYEDAQENFKFARKIKMQDPNTLLGLAIHSLRLTKTVQAVDFYLDVQEMDPKNKIAKKALAVIRKHSASEALSDWMAAENNLKKLFPPIPAPAASLNTIVKIVIIIASVFLLTYGILAMLKILPSPFKQANQRQTAEYALSGAEKNNAVQAGGYFQTNPLTQDQVIRLYNEALSFFTDYRDEKAKINLNKILLSNASQSIKNRAQLMINSMEEPGFHNFKSKDNVSFTEVSKEPAVYKDVFVLWHGMARNVELTDEYTYFDFIVSYDTRTMLEGIVYVFMSGPYKINTERDMEILGKIVLDGNSTNGFILEGTAVHQSGRLEE